MGSMRPSQYLVSAVLPGVLLSCLGCSARLESVSSQGCSPMPTIDWHLPRSQVQHQVRRAVVCTRDGLDQALRSIKTRISGELSISELRALQQLGIVSTGMSTDADWGFLAGIVSVVHPQGRPALKFDKLRRVLDWVDTRSSWWVKYFQGDSEGVLMAPSDEQFLGELIDFIEPHGALSKQALTSVFRTVPFSTVLGVQAGDSLNRAVDLGWSLTELATGQPREDVKGVEIARVLNSWVKSFFEVLNSTRGGQEAVTYFQDVRQQEDPALVFRALFASGAAQIRWYFR